MALIKLNNQSLTNVSALPAGVGGKVLQVKQVSTGVFLQNTTTSYVDSSAWLEVFNVSPDVFAP